MSSSRPRCLALVVIIRIYCHAETQEVHVHFSASGAFVRKESWPQHSSRAEEMTPILTPQIAAEASPATPGSEEYPWPILPLCQFDASGEFHDSVRVFVNKDNTRAFVFNKDAKGAQTKVQCHGATPGACLRPHFHGNGMLQSCEDLHCECQQVTLGLDTVQSHYVREMIKKVGTTCRSAGDTRILQIGLGGAAMSSYLLEKCGEGTWITSVEKDPRIITMAEKFFGFKVDIGKNEVENLDAAEAVQRHLDKGNRYDYILIDCFEAGGRIPESCRSKRFIEGVRGILKGNGVALHQVWAAQYNELYHGYNDVFGHEHLSSEPVDGDQNFLLLAKGA